MRINVRKMALSQPPSAASRNRWSSHVTRVTNARRSHVVLGAARSPSRWSLTSALVYLTWSSPPRTSTFALESWAPRSGAHRSVLLPRVRHRQPQWSCDGHPSGASGWGGGRRRLGVSHACRVAERAQGLVGHRRRKGGCRARVRPLARPPRMCVSRSVS